jgi:hypothetical protein
VKHFLGFVEFARKPLPAGARFSPKHVFVATNNPRTENYIKSVMQRKQMIEQINERVARQSHKYVFGFSDAQLLFVSRRLGMKYTANPIENMRYE